MIARALAWISGHRTISVGALAAVALAALGVWARCRPAPPPPPAATTASTVQTVASHAAGEQVVNTVTQQKKERRVRKPDGTTIDTTTTTTTASGSTATWAQGGSSTTAATSTSTPVAPPRAPRLGISFGAEYDRAPWRVGWKPTTYRAGADAPVGEVLGVKLRLGASATFVRSVKPESVGLYVRAEVP